MNPASESRRWFYSIPKVLRDAATVLGSKRSTGWLLRVWVTRKPGVPLESREPLRAKPAIGNPWRPDAPLAAWADSPRLAAAMLCAIASPYRFRIPPRLPLRHFVQPTGSLHNGHFELPKLTGTIG